MSETATTTPTGDAPATTPTTVRGTVSYQLSTAGQRAALAAGLPAQQVQTGEADIPVSLLPLCAVAPDGAVALDLAKVWPSPDQPGYKDTVSRGWGASEHDAPLSDPVAALQAAEAVAQAAYGAARAAYLAREEERRASLVSRLEEELDRAEADPSIMHRAWSSIGDASLPPAVAERFAAVARLVEGRAAAARERAEAARQVQQQTEEAAAEAKRTYLSAWIREHGTSNQRERLDAELLGEDEMLASVKDWAFARLDAPRYQRITADDVAALFDDPPEVREQDVTYKAEDADQVTARQWAAYKALLVQIDDPTATVTLRRHRGWWDQRAKNDDPEVVRYSLQVRLRRGPLVLTREYAAPDA